METKRRYREEHHTFRGQSSYQTAILGTWRPWTVTDPWFTRFVDSQRTISVNTSFHAIQRARKRYPKLKDLLARSDTGSDFFSVKREISGNFTQVDFLRQSTPNNRIRYVGHLLPLNPADVNGSVLPSSLTIGERLDMYAAGSTAIARCAPNNPVASLANFLGELKRDGLPSLPGAQLREHVQKGRSLKGSGSEYLNWQFATVPFLSDLRGFANTVKNHDKILNQYARDSGKLIRRRYRFPSEVSEATTTVNNRFPWGPSSTDFYQSGGTLSKTTKVEIDTWFSGAFCYFLPNEESGIRALDQYIDKADRLFGIKPDPEVLWNLSPWSWAVDWFSNMGDVFKNVSRFTTDGLIMPYGYVMRKIVITETYTLSGLIPKPSIERYSVPEPLTVQYTVKSRVAATPFGFGVNIGALSARQNAIVVALGLSRGGSLAK